MTLTLTPLRNIPIIRHGDNLADLVVDGLALNGIVAADDDIVVFAQKIVSKAEGRVVNLEDVAPSAHAFTLAAETGKDPRLIELTIQESREILRTRPGTIIVEHRLGFVCANAGIDHSNVGGAHDTLVLLLPENPDGAAADIRSQLESRTGRRIGVLIIDSHGRAWRNGTVGTAIGLSGLPGLLDLRGSPDLFGRELRITQVGVADELAAAASLVMGQAAEATPIVHVRGFPYELREGSLAELIRPRETDFFR